jgi:hypothetical protein
MNTSTFERTATAIDVQVSASELTVRLADGRRLSVPLDWYPRLLHGTRAERKNWQIFAEGTAIEWPDLDEHIGVDGLLAGRRSSESKTSLAKWLANRRR